MKFGIISDIHGNIDALDAVITSARQNNVNTFFCAGDFVGYYYDPDLVIDKLKDFSLFCVRGNHENMLFECKRKPSSIAKYRSKYGFGLEIALQKLNTEHFGFLQNLPKTLEINIQNKKILICHGSPWDTDQYIYPDASSELFEKCFSYDFDYLVMGHTHYPMIKEQNGKKIINPGSVGQARGKGRGFAQWGLIDLDKDEVSLKETQYTKADLFKKINDIDPNNNYLLDVLNEKN
jgi:putative phosphoesterase